jgi:predicted nucleic acid-binding protein
MHAVAEKHVSSAGTAWHLLSRILLLSTRLPPEFRLSPADAAQLLEDEIFARMAVNDLPPGSRLTMLKMAAQDGTAGGRIYDAHIAEVARATGATVIVTDDRRHFIAALRHGIRVETPSEFLVGFRGRK